MSTSAWDYVVKNEKRIMSLLVRAAHGNRDWAHEMYGDVVLERIVRIFELYDGVRPVDNYVLNTIRWYAFKWVNRRRDHQIIEETYPVRDSDSHLDALESLSEVEHYLIEAKVFYDMSYKDIAAELGWSVSQVVRSYQYVCDKLRTMYEV